MRRPYFASGKARIWENRITPVVLLTQPECAVNARCLEENKKPRLAGLFEREERMMGLEPTTFCMASRRSSQLSYIRERGPV
jgi:hypothetical protein